ncbi:disease resistance protein At4g27190-like [Neltuma alba]|uniref:disease resistance protein At4g27190-like n=1 Tax=Neltuma alba TaxID=207710 RepID=UPI0010A43878|nr:disease resistance protein At4g27190-like [Prosopis alba]
MAEIAIAGVIVPAVATLAAPVLQLLLSKAGTRSISLAGTHEVLNYGLAQLRAQQMDKDRAVWSHSEQKDPSEAYKLWKERVSHIEKEVAFVNEKYHKLGTRKRRLLKRIGFQNEIKRVLSHVIRILEQCPEEILVDKQLEWVIKEISVPPIGKYPTLNKAFWEIQNLLTDNEVKCVALHGQKGVGKTTIMRNLNNHFCSVDKLFDMVIFIKVLADEQTDPQAEYLDILQKIAVRVKVNGEGNESEVVGRIQKVLENKRYLLILDDIRYKPDEIWKKLNISKDQKDSKVVITTHYPLALKSNYINRDVKLKELSPHEAQSMFRDIASVKVLPPNAKLICKRFCSCLPLLIDPIAKSFSYQEDPPDWLTALNECMPWPQVGVNGLKEIFSTLENYCYKRLRGQSEQKCFLYASLYPANSKIYTDYLVECCIAQGFLGKVDATTKYSGMRTRAIDSVLRSLVNVSFLEEGEQMRYVKMNDLYRQLALHILYNNSEGRTYFDNEKHKEPFRSESWQHARWVSMVGSKRDSLPANQNCGSLQALLLQKNPRLAEIPLDFFKSMSNLLVLNLYRTKISKLPSLTELTGLKAFYVNGCSRLKICSHDIQPLQHLEVLDIRGTKINFVPYLASLWCLRISYFASSNYDGISELHRLEELTIEVKSPSKWCDDAENIIQKVASLENLTTFRCSFPSSETLGKFLETSKSRRGKKQFTPCQFFVRSENSQNPKIIESLDDDRISKCVKYCNGDERVDLAITEMLPQVKAFELICHKSIGTLLELVETSNPECLHDLLIEGCNQMSIIVEGDKVYNINGTNAGLLPNLQQLHLDNLEHLRIVFRGPFYFGSFSMLHTLKLKNCPELTSIFSQVANIDFPKLEKLVVQNCSRLEVLFKVPAKGEQRILPELKVLVLDSLSNFKFICSSENLVWRSLEKLNVRKCPHLKTLPFNTINAANLKTIEGEQEWWSNLDWTHPMVHEKFTSAFSASN